MTNEEKYKTPEERQEAFETFCESQRFDNMPCSKCCEIRNNKSKASCEYIWLALEAEEDKPLTCPFCGADGIITEVKGGGFKVFCVECLSMSSAYTTKDKAIAAWNRREK